MKECRDNGSVETLMEYSYVYLIVQILELVMTFYMLTLGKYINIYLLYL